MSRRGRAGVGSSMHVHRKAETVDEAMATCFTTRHRTFSTMCSISTSPGGSFEGPTTRKKSPVSPGFLRAGMDRSRLMEVSSAEQLLRAFNDAHIRRSRGDVSEEMKYSEEGMRKLKDATVAMCSKATHATLGICASSSSQGVRALKDYVSQLGLPRGRLHGMDRNGVEISVEGAVFIKYNSNTGDADLSGYAGEYRGVLFTPMLVDGLFRQYGYLPLSLFEDDSE